MRILEVLSIVLDALAIMDILQSSKAVEKKILWVIVVLLFPVIGAVIYVTIGRKPIA